MEQKEKVSKLKESVHNLTKVAKDRYGLNFLNVSDIKNTFFEKMKKHNNFTRQ